MTKPVLVVRPEALADLVTARDWYDERQPGLGDRFLDAVDHMIQRIMDRPTAYERVVGQARRVKLARFPYVIYFRDLPRRLEILAVLHGRQHEQHWEERL
jgi:plasmid stabilization system protein ParE